jgi:hypothetical protein
MVREMKNCNDGRPFSRGGTKGLHRREQEKTSGFLPIPKYLLRINQITKMNNYQYE